MQCVLDLLRRGGITESVGPHSRYYSATSLGSYLRATGAHEEFNGLITSWIMDGAPSQELWEVQRTKLLVLLGIDAEEDAVKKYLVYSDCNDDDNVIARVGTANIYRSASGREIEIGTIHSVKGETHDATLILETKNHEFDLEKLWGRLSFTESGSISGKRKQQFARQLYVAASRPCRLLCMAAHQDRIQPDVRMRLEQYGWIIQLV